VADQDAPKKATRSTTRNAAAAPVAVAALPNSSPGKKTTLDAPAPVIDIDNSPPGKKVGKDSSLDVAAPIININDVSRPSNAKSFQEIADELRSRPVAAPLNVRQRMFSRGLNAKSNERVEEEKQASHLGVREEVAAAATTATYRERYRSDFDDNESGVDYGDSESVSDWGGMLLVRGNTL
jgi:hypothetical protein